MKNLFFVVPATILFGFCSLIAQNPDGNNFNSYYTDQFANIVPPTPNAANFMQYGNTPVNASSGLPSISIPIYTIEEDGVQVPISISYNASGIMVEDISSTVGLKWSLNAGGMVSRTINDLNDFRDDGGELGWLVDISNGNSHFDQWLIDNNSYNYSIKDNREQLQEFLTEHDNFPDSFNYNFLGYSNSFVFKPDGDIIKGDYKDNLELSSYAENSFGFDDIYGNEYSFGVLEKNRIDSYSFVEGGDTFSHSHTQDNVGWMLSGIATKNGKSISFTYEEYAYDYGYNLVSQQLVSSPEWECMYTPRLGATKEGSHIYYDHSMHTTRIDNETKNQLVRFIRTDNVEVEFVYTSGPVNSKSVSGWDKRIDRIIIRDRLQNKEKEFKFSYDVFNGDSRLKLTQVQEKGFDNTWKPPYRFTYEAGDLPSINSFGRDYKGYYNGRNLPYYNGQYYPVNTSLLPKTKSTLDRVYQFTGPSATVTVHPGYEKLSDRYFYEPFLKYGSLIKIEYPTGGSTEFIYEPNAFGNNTEEPLLDMEEFEFDNQNYFGYTGSYGSDDQGYIVFNFLTDNLKGFAGKMRVWPTDECPFCFDESNIDVPQLRIFEYEGSMIPNNQLTKTIIDQNRGALIMRGSLWVGPGNPQNPNSVSNYPITYIGYHDPSNVSTYEFDKFNGIYLVQMRMATTNYDPNAVINAKFQYNKSQYDENGDPIYQKHYFGGLRIKEIKDIDVGGNAYNRTNYSYISGESPNPFKTSDDGNVQRLGGRDTFTPERQWLPNTNVVNGYWYSNVEIEKIGPGSYGKTKEYYLSNGSFRNVSSGELYQKEVFDKDGNLLSMEHTDFKSSAPLAYDLTFAVPSTQDAPYFDTDISCNYEVGGVPMTWSEPLPYGDYSSNTMQQYYRGAWRVPDSTMTTQFLLTSNGLKPVTTVKKYDYQTDPFLLEKEKIDTRYTATLDTNGNIDGYSLDNPNGEVIETEYHYTKELKPDPIPWTVPDGLPISKEVFDLNDTNNGNDDLKILGQYFEYDAQGNIQKTYRYSKGGGTHSGGATYVPADYELDVSYLTDEGKPTQVRGQDGVITSYIWGYNKQYPVAKIVGLSYAIAIATPGFNLAVANTSLDAQTIQDEINKIRVAHSSSQITTYTYKPMIGVNSIIDPKGLKTTYYYDGLGRLQYVKDQDGNILGKNEYHYKN